MSSDIFAGVPFPHWPLRATAGMALFTLAITAAARIFGWVPEHGADTPVRVERDLRFVEHRSGGVEVSAGGIDVIDARTGRKIDELRPGADGFIRATLRGLAQERKRHGLGPEVPFHLALHTDGRLLLVDPALDRIIELEAFGPTNSGAFARLLPAAPPLAAAALPRPNP